MIEQRTLSAPLNQYQRQDGHFIDYGLYVLPGLANHPHGGVFRGPPVRGPGYIACVGAAQTFGRFVREPFPMLLGNDLGRECMNLGSGGAGPTFFTASDELMAQINRSTLAIVQVMSARSISNSQFRIKFHGAWGTRLADGAEMSAADFFTDLLGSGAEAARRVTQETRAAYVTAMTRLLDAITVPKILLWFSTRRPDYRENYRPPLPNLFGEFPHLVNRPMLQALAPHADAYVECVSQAGLPQPLVGSDGEPVSVLTQVRPGDQTRITVNSYYPSSEMHREAARKLAPTCTHLLQRKGNTQRPEKCGEQGRKTTSASMQLLTRPAPAPSPKRFEGSTPVVMTAKRPDGPNRAPRPIRLEWNGTARHHRSGWQYALSSIADLHEASGVLFDAAIEKTFSWSRRSTPGWTGHAEPWVGVVHNPPGVPPWFNDNLQSPTSIQATSEWQSSMSTCRGLFTLSDYLRDWLAPRVPVLVESLRHPTAEPERRFDAAAFLRNPRKKLIQVGWWLRRFHSLYLLPDTPYERVMLDIQEPWARRAMDAELEFVPPSARDEVQVLPYVQAEEYDSLLSRNIVFLDLYDSSANNALIECIARATPVLVNPVPAVREYLGDDYPLYFGSLDEAADKISNEQLLLTAHEYLQDSPARPSLTGNSFRESIVTSHIISSLS